MMSAPVSPSRPPSLRALLLPREHGSWSLALEPLALGLIAAPSWAGGALALGAAALFFARRPWQAARSGDVRLRPAVTALVVLGFVAASALVAGVWFARGPGPVTFALLAALPASAAFAWFDRRKAGREMMAELCGAACFAVFPAAIALAAGRHPELALVLAGFAFARSATAILTIRTFLRRRKGEPARRWPTVCLTVATVVVFGLYANHTGRWVPLLWTGVFLVRATTLLGPAAPKLTARQLGMLEAVLGLMVTVTTGISFQH